MNVPGLAVVLLVAVLVLSTNGDGSDLCVTTFHEFEKGAIFDSPGNVAVLVSAFYPTNKPVPLSVQVVFHVNSNSSNGTDAYISTDPDCPAGKEMWLWVASPVFIFMEPTKLNLCALYTLNYFQIWNPPQAHLYVPEICNISYNKFNFLNDLTSQVQMYAAAHLYDKNINQAYVLRGCGDEALTTLLPTTLQNNGQSLETLSKVLIIIYLTGHLFLIAGILLFICFFLHQYGTEIANNDPNLQPSMDKYGLFWAAVVLSVVGNVLLTWHAFAIIKPYVTSGAHDLHTDGWIVLAQLLIILISSLIVAIIFSRRLDLSIPMMFLQPFISLSSDGSVGKSKKIVQCLSLWSLILFILHIFGRAGFIFLALLALPPTVLFTLLIYLIAVICTVQFLAILFTFCKMKKKQWVQHHLLAHVMDLLQALAFTLLFSAVLCFGLLISAIGALANYGNVTVSLYSVFSIVFTPLGLAVAVWVLRVTGKKWLHIHGKTYPAVGATADHERWYMDEDASSQQSEYDML